VQSITLLYDQLTPISVYHKLGSFFGEELGFLFESVINSESGNSSFLFFGARERLVYQNKKTYHTDELGNVHTLNQDPLSYLQSRYSSMDKEPYKKLANELGVGFVDGFIGYIGYDAVKIFEPRLSSHMDNLHDPIGIADIDLIRPRLVCVFSHKTNRLTLLTFDPTLENRLDEIAKHLKDPHIYIPIKTTEIDPDNGNFAFNKERFFEMIDQSKKMIESGDVFQILMSNRFTQYAEIDFLSFYRTLRSKNPSPYMFLLNFLSHAIAGSSPEVMVGLKDGSILLRPIAGTRKRGKNPIRDKELEDELLADEKERAEHLMLIDLGRNDVGRVARAGSVKVQDMMRVERYSHVMHLVSDVEGVLDNQYDMFDLFRATFTAGTMTGTPKIRAMELIADFEGLKRSFYSGAVGYFGFDGNMDSAIMIRTSYLDHEKIIFQAGAGVVADSKPELEYLEVHNKLAALMSSLDDLRKP
jgi:anthranilate synthase component 1